MKKTRTRSHTNASLAARATTHAAAIHHTTHETNILAVLSFIFGLFFFVPFASIVAIVFGFVALNQMTRTAESGRGLAIAGIILGFFWTILYLFFIVMALLFLTGLVATGIHVAATLPSTL